MNKKNFFPTLYPKDRDLQKTWFLKFKDASGKPQKRYGRLNILTTVDERLKEAEKIIQAESERIQPAIPKDIASLIFELLEERRPLYKKKTYQCYCTFVYKFSTWYSTNKDIDSALFLSHLHAEGYHKNYIRKWIITLSAFFKILVKRGSLKRNPFEEIRVKKVKSQSLLPFHDLQIEALKTSILKEAKDEQLWDACLFQYYLFFRPHEIRLLQIENILFEAMQIECGVDITKDQDVLRKGIPEPMRERIEKYKGLPPKWFIFSKNGQPGPTPVSINYLSRKHKKHLNKLGFSNKYGFYSWVHTGIKKAAMGGKIPLKQLQLQKGHSDLKVFSEYLKNIGVEDCEQLVTQFPAI